MHSFLMAACVQLPHGCRGVGMCWHLDMAPKLLRQKVLLDIVMRCLLDERLWTEQLS